MGLELRATPFDSILTEFWTHRIAANDFNYNENDAQKYSQFHVLAYAITSAEGPSIPSFQTVVCKTTEVLPGSNYVIA